jgi:hypothetical protein
MGSGYAGFSKNGRNSMAFEPVSFEGKKILLTGATGMVSRPLVR